MMRTLRPFFAVGLCFFLGCASVFRQYESVTTGPTAEVTIERNAAASKFDVVIFRDTPDCSFPFDGRVTLEPGELSRTIRMPAGRGYFRLSPAQDGYQSLGLTDISFRLEEGRRYQVRFDWGGRAETGWFERQKGKFELSYFDVTDGEPVPVDTDHFSVCERERDGR